MTRGLWMMVGLIGCSGQTVGTGGTDKTGTGTTGTTDTTSDPQPEQACDDGRDNDGDGDTDCEDSDCAGEPQCSWPAAVAFETLIEFAGNGLAHAAGYDDCSVHVTSDLATDDSQSCDGCDRVFTGTFTYLDDNCPADFDRPPEGSYGVAFTADDRWEIWGQLDGAWTSIGTATDDGTGTLRISDTQPLEASGVNVGDLTTYFAFTP